MVVRELVGVGVGRREVATAVRSLEAEVRLGISDRKLGELEPEELMNLVEAAHRMYAERDFSGLKTIAELYELDVERRLWDHASPSVVVKQLGKAREMYQEALSVFRAAKAEEKELSIPGFEGYLEERIASVEQKIMHKAPWNYKLRELGSAATLAEPVLAGR